MDRMKIPLAIIGGGNMAQAIVSGGMAGGVLDGPLVLVAEPDAQKRRTLAAMGVGTCPSASEALVWLGDTEQPDAPGQVLLAVKPQSLRALAEELRPALAGSERVVISILAGTRSEDVRRSLDAPVRVVRAMPNTPAQIRRGVTAVALGAGARPGDESCAKRIFSGVGQVVEIEERMMDAFTAVASSGPAYVFFLAEAMATAAVQLGFDRAVAEQIVRETVAGSGALLAASSDPPRVLRERVTSKGGTTAAAVGVLHTGDVLDTVVRAIRAARDRGVEMAKE